jgi:hypothetical protein
MIGAISRSACGSAGSDVAAPDDWVAKGVRLPAGTELRASYKGQTYLARVAAGALVLEGSRFDSPSAAAMSITRHPVTGWTFWECRLPGQGRRVKLKALRRSRDTARRPRVHRCCSSGPQRRPS